MLLVINEYVNESKVLPLFTKSILPTSYVSQNSNLCPTVQLNSFFIRCHNHVVVHHYLQHSKSLTFYFVMHHPVFGINCLIHCVEHRQSCLDSPRQLRVSSSLSLSPLSSPITSSLFHSRLKTYLLDKSFPP